jgi:hypothetical protein
MNILPVVQPVIRLLIWGQDRGIRRAFNWK